MNNNRRSRFEVDPLEAPAEILAKKFSIIIEAMENRQYCKKSMPWNKVFFLLSLSRSVYRIDFHIRQNDKVEGIIHSAI